MKDQTMKTERRVKMNRSKHPAIRLFALFMTLFITGQSIAQNQQGHHEEVVIIGSTDPVVNQSKKINLMPEQPVQPEVNTDYKFVPINKYFYTPAVFSPIKPASFRSYIANDIYNNVIRLGFGTRISPYGEIFHSQAHKGKYKFDFHALHHSTFGKIDGYTDAPSSRSLAEAGFTRYLKTHTLEFNAGYEYKTNRNYYDSNDADTINTDSLKIAYNLFFFDGVLSSNYKNNKSLHHQIKLGGYYFFNKRQQDYYNQSDELNIFTDLDVHKSFRVTDVLDYQRLGVAGRIEFYQNNGIIDYTNGIDSSSVINVLASATPYFKARYGIMGFKAGVNLSYLYNDSDSHFRVFPDIYINVNLMPEYLELYAGADGKYEKNSYKKMAYENPFISPLITDRWTAEKIRVFGGFKGNIAKQVSFNVEISWSTFSDDYFFISLYQDNTPVQKYGNTFMIANDDGNRLTFKTQVSYNLLRKANVYFSYQYHSYNLDSLPEPSGKLLSELRVGGSYLIRNKFKPWAEILYTGKRQALNANNNFTTDPYNIIELTGFADINIGMEYYHNEHLSGFLRITNLFNNKYQYFYKHPNYGIEVMFGVGYKF
jgi:hypothetical protein